MKILSALTYYAPHWTGLTMHAQRVAEGLAARGHHVTVLTIQHEPTLPTDGSAVGRQPVRLEPRRDDKQERKHGAQDGVACGADPRGVML